MGYIMNVSAIVMAAGLSLRMQQNKLLMKIGEKHIFEFILETINRCKCFNEVVVVANEETILARAAELGFKAVKNEFSHIGQSESIKIGIQSSSNADGYMFFTADQPFISEETIKKLMAAFKSDQNNIVVPSYNGNVGSPAIFPSCLKKHLLMLQKDNGGKAIIKENLERTTKVNICSEMENMDIDTVEDYEKVQKKKVIE